MLCPQVPPFIFCKMDNHGPQELPAGPMDHPWAGVRRKHGPNRVKSGVTILEIPSYSAKNRAKCRGPEGKTPDPNILRPASQWKVEGRPRGCWGRYHASGDVWGSQSLFPWGSAALRSHDGSTACAGHQGQRATTAPNAGWEAQPLRSTRGAAAGCWQVEGLPRGPKGYTEAQDPRSDRHL